MGCGYAVVKEPRRWGGDLSWGSPAAKVARAGVEPASREAPGFEPGVVSNFTTGPNGEARVHGKKNKFWEGFPADQRLIWLLRYRLMDSVRAESWSPASRHRARTTTRPAAAVWRLVAGGSCGTCGSQGHSRQRGGYCRRSRSRGKSGLSGIYYAYLVPKGEIFHLIRLNSGFPGLFSVILG